VQSTEYRVQRKQASRRTRPAFYSLVVWQKAQDLAARIAEVVDDLPRARSAENLGNQAVRSAASVPANIAEGYGRYSEAAYRQFLSIARGSLYETESTIDLFERPRYVSEDVASSLIDDAEGVARLITATMKPLKPAGAVLRDEDVPHEA
jgi:four helix bundle protein